MNSDLWELLHDGSIVAITVVGQQDLVITTDIPYLRKMFDDTGTAFLIRLRQCYRFQYRDYSDNQWNDSFVDIVRAEPIMLSVKANTGQEILITCTEGQLRMQYESYTISLDTGIPITLEELVTAADCYWQEWERKNHE